MPWLGFFHKISKCETVVLFDHVFASRGKSWHNRNRLLINGEPKWLTMPIERKGKGFQRYYEIKINTNINKRKQTKSIEMSYLKTDYFHEIFPLIKQLFEANYEYLLDFNLEFIKVITQGLGLNPAFISSQDLACKNPDLITFTQNDLVLQTCIDVGATEYFSGTGCLDFIRPETFTEKGIKFYFQKFKHPEYQQKNSRGNSFISNLSILDALFNIGFSGTRKTLMGA